MIRPLKPQSFLRHATLGCVLGLGLMLVYGSVLGGCASSQSTASADQEGPPPEGYETWDDYWKGKDKDYSDFDADVQRHRMTRPDVPGARR